MPRCSQCGRLVSIHQHGCPECDRGVSEGHDPLPAEDFPEREPLIEESEFDENESHSRRLPIARFQSGAEAGYFADELARAVDLDVRVLAREHYDAVHGVASTDFVLLVLETEAERAAQLLRSLVASTDDDEAPDESNLLAAEHDFNSSALMGGPVWVPLLLTLAAGSIAYWGIEKFEQRQRPPALINRDRRQPPELWRVLSASPSPWVQTLGPGRGTRQLQVDPATKSAVIQEDRDGDGRFEREWAYSWQDDAR